VSRRYSVLGMGVCRTVQEQRQLLSMLVFLNKIGENDNKNDVTNYNRIDNIEE
jgi:hypothetical protein